MLDRRVRVIIFVLVLLLEEKHSVFLIKYDVICGCFIDTLYLVEEISFYSYFIWEVLLFVCFFKSGIEV